MGAGLEAVKARMKEIAEKRKNNEASNVEIDLYTTLEIVNEMWERGFKFGKLDLYRSDATEFIIDGDTLIPPFVAMDGLGENVAKQIVRARKEGEFLSKTELRKTWRRLLNLGRKDGRDGNPWQYARRQPAQSL